MAIAGTVSAHSDTLAGSMVGAFSPAITNARGANDWEKMRRMAYRTCKIGTLLTLLFALPLALELPEILRLWLKHPPEAAVGLCWSILAMVVVDKTAVGHMLAVNANGRMAKYQMVLGTTLILTLPLAWLFVALGWGLYAVGWAMVLTMMGCAWGRVWFARKLVGMSARYWLFHIFLPLVLLTVLSGSVGLLPQLFLAPSFGRVCLTTAVTEAVMLPTAWFLLLDREERDFLLRRLPILKRLRRVA